jgi:hypothetical protein
MDSTRIYNLNSAGVIKIKNKMADPYGIAYRPGKLCWKPTVKITLKMQTVYAVLC